MPSRHSSQICLVAAFALALSTALLAADGSSVTMYRWVDAQGVVHYSDTPQPGAEQIKVQGAQGYSAPPAPKTTAPAAAPAKPAASYQSCAIAAPSGEQTLFAPDSVQVTVNVAPGLRDGDQLIVTYDGTPLSAPSPGAVSFVVDQPDRGAHSLNATVRDPNGTTLCTAPTVMFYVQRPSLRSPLAPAAGR